MFEFGFLVLGKGFGNKEIEIVLNEIDKSLLYFVIFRIDCFF